MSIEAPLFTFYWDFKEILCKAYLLFNCFLEMKRILKALISFIPWLLNFSDMPNYGSYLRKRYTLRLLSKYLRRSITSIVPKKPQPIRFPLWFSYMSSYSYILAKLSQNGATFILKLTLGFKNHMRNLENFRQAMEVQKAEIQWATFVQKIHSLS